MSGATVRRKPAAPAPKAEKPPEETHHDLAREWIIGRAIGDHLPVYTNGSFYVPTEGGQWEALTIERAQVEIAQQFNGLSKLCKKANDYRGIASHAADMVLEDDFFDTAAVGVTTPDGFHRLVGRTVHLEPLSLTHRQVFALKWAPRTFGPPALFDAMLSAAFADDHEKKQVDLFWQLLGATLFGLLPIHQRVVLLIGKEKSGKSTVQRALELMFPRDAVSAVSPSSWTSEYYLAGLAGKRLNVVGELSDDLPIPAAAFKNLTGGNLIGARHPTHRPFYYTCRAAHWFASNVLPPTTDRTEAFWRRWSVLRFSNRVADDKADPGLLEKIVAREMPAILAKAFKGAEAVAAAGGIRSTPAQDAVIAKWKAAANPVLQFLLDDEWIELDRLCLGSKTRDVYDAYRRWAAYAGFRNPFGRNHFLDLLDSTGAAVGVVVAKEGGQAIVRGLRLVRRDEL